MSPSDIEAEEAMDRMVQVIGIFPTQQETINAIAALEREGFGQESMKVLASSHESSSRIEAETDAHVDELNDLTQTRRETGGREADLALPLSYASAASSAPAYSAIGYAGLSSFTAGAYPAGLLVWRAGDRDDGSEEALQVLGLEGESLRACRAAVMDGRFVLAVEPPEEAAASRAKLVLMEAGAELV